VRAMGKVFHLFARLPLLHRRPGDVEPLGQRPLSALRRLNLRPRPRGRSRLGVDFAYLAGLSAEGFKDAVH
jgi:hypothetical protein